MKIALNEISKITSAYIIRDNNFENIPLTQKIVTIQNITTNQILEIKDLKKVPAEIFTKPSYLQNSNILLSSRNNFKACIYNKVNNENIIATGNIFIIELCSELVLHEYLMIYINSDQAQKQFAKMNLGVTLPHITKEHLLELEVIVPSIMLQKQIIELEDNRQKILNLLRVKTKLIDQIYSQNIKNLI